MCKVLLSLSASARESKDESDAHKGIENEESNKLSSDEVDNIERAWDESATSRILNAVSQQLVYDGLHSVLVQLKIPLPMPKRARLVITYLYCFLTM